MADLDGHFLDANPALCQLLGYSKEELLLTSVRAITHPHDVEGLVAGTRQLLAGETRRFQAEQRYLHADGRVGWALISVSLIGDLNGRPCYYVLGIDDVTPRQNIERLRAIPIALMRVLAEATASEDASRRILQRLCEDLGWEVGQLWMLDRVEDGLRMRDFWHAPSLEVAMFRRSIPKRVCSPESMCQVASGLGGNRCGSSTWPRIPTSRRLQLRRACTGRLASRS